MHDDPAPHDDDRLQAQYDGIPVPCYTWRAQDGDFVLERANRAAVALGGEATLGLLGRRASELYPSYPQIVADLRTCLSERRTVRRELDYVLAATGDARRLDVSYVFMPPAHVMVHADDVTERRAQEERLRASEERFRAVIGTLDAGVLTFDGDGRTVDANPAACAILGLRRERLLGDPHWWRALAPRFEDGTPVRGEAVAAAADGCEAVRDVTMVLTRPEGDETTIALTRQPLRNGLVISIADLTESRRLRERVVQQALHDPLTGLPNRMLFQERLEQALARVHRPRVGVVLLGLDRFKAVNDAGGHAAGDELLAHIAARLQHVLDIAQPLARFGGDEFAVLAELGEEREAVALAQRLAGALEDPFTAPGAEHPVSLTASIGIAVEDGRLNSAADLVQGADAAMHRVKARGGAAYEIFDREMEGRLRDRLRIEDGLRSALERDELRLHYQPIVALDPRRTIALEGLVRWQHPTRGLLAPGAFLPVAEQQGRLISAIGDWVLERALRDAAGWPEHLHVNVNVSARELGEPAFAERIARTVAASGIAPGRIALEITETALMEGGAPAIAGLDDLSALGVTLYLDDFGTGYSSLTRLARLPLTGIKLDRGFVARATDERDRRIIEAALSLGRAAELGVVAEGVETDEQLALLRACGCDCAQGFLLGRPVAPEQLVLT